MSIKNWFKDYFNGLFNPPESLEVMSEREFEELFAATEEEEWDDE